MSYLNDKMLAELCEKHQLVQPYDPSRVNPASIDLALGREFVNLSEQQIHYIPDAGVGKGTHAEPGERFWADNVFLHPGVALLATTAERVAIPDHPILLMGESNIDPMEAKTAFDWIYAPQYLPACTGELRLKSSAARNGLDHALAGWIDPGFDGTLTLELHAHRPIELVAGKCYVQLVVATMLAAPARSYLQTGRYVGESAIGAVLAKEDR